MNFSNCSVECFDCGGLFSIEEFPMSECPNCGSENIFKEGDFQVAIETDQWNSMIHSGEFSNQDIIDLLNERDYLMHIYSRSKHFRNIANNLGKLFSEDKENA